MTSLDSARLNYGGNDAVAENGNNHSRQSDASHTSDGVDLSAEPTYDREYNHLLTLEEAGDETICTDGGTESISYDVHRCGGCARVYGDEDKITSRIGDDGEVITYDEPRCPHCGTEVSNENTLTTEATFELDETEAVDR